MKTGFGSNKEWTPRYELKTTLLMYDVGKENRLSYPIVPLHVYKLRNWLIHC